MKTNNKNGKSKVAAVKPAKEAKEKNAMDALAVAVGRADQLVKSLREAHSAACHENGLLALVLLGRLESATGLQRKLGHIQNCMS